MNRDFEIKEGIYLTQCARELDLHNDFDFLGVEYSVERRTALLRWRRSSGDWVRSSAPACVSVEFREVREFHFLPRDPEIPFTEDDCVSEWGYWPDEDWADGVIVTGPNQPPDPRWATGVRFMSGATIAIRASSAHATITP